MHKAMKLCSFLFSCLLCMNICVVQAASYEISFRGGVNGTVEGQKSVTYTVEENSKFPDEPQVEAKDGYVFVGWNKQLPEVGSLVNGKEVYVARYAAVVSGIRYTVHYVNEIGVDIATQRTMVAEEGNEVTLRAKVIAGYESKEKQRKVIVDKEHHVFKFVYKLIDKDAVDKNANQNQQTQQTTGTATSQVSGQEQTVDKETDAVNGNTKDEIKTEKEEENKTPLAGLFGNDHSNIGYLAAGAGCLLFLILLFFWKKRKKEKETQQ